MKFGYFNKLIEGIGLAVFLTVNIMIFPASANEEVDVEKCYGIVTKGQDDGMNSGPDKDIPGSSQIDYDPNAFKFVKKGTCTSIKTPTGHGSLVPKDFSASQ